MTPEDEAFDELAKRQGMWGGGFPAKRQAAMDKINSDFDEEYKKSHSELVKYRIEEDDDIQDYKKPWVGLTDGEVTEGLCRTRYALQTAAAWVDGVEWATKQLKEKNT